MGVAHILMSRFLGYLSYALHLIMLIIILIQFIDSVTALHLPAPFNGTVYPPTPSIFQPETQLRTLTSRTRYDVFYGVSRAVPGTFERMIRYHIGLLRSATTPST